MRALALLLVVVAAFVAPAASAHLGLPGGRTPFVVDGAFTGGGTTWGVVLDDSDGGYARVCEESVGSIVYFQERTVAGIVLLGAGTGLFATTDGGCTYQPAAEALQGATVSQIAVAVDAPLRIFVSFSPDDGATLFKSDDGGLTFSALDLLVSSFTFQSLVASADGGRVYASGATSDGEAPRAFASTDGGATWTERTFWPDGAKYAHVRAMDVDGEHVLVTAFDDTPGSTLLQVDRDLGAPVELHRFDRVVTDVAAHFGRRFALESESILWRQDDGGAFELVVDGPVNCIRRVAGDARLWGCGGPAQGAHFFSSDDGVAWSPALPFDTVAERVCPAGTPGEVQCRRPVQTDAGDEDAGQDDEDAGAGGAGAARPRVPCACAASPAGATSAAASGATPWTALLLFAIAGLTSLRSSARGRRQSP